MQKIEWQRKINDVIQVVEKTGEILLKSGAEIFRVEDTLKRMLGSIPNVSEIHVYAVPSAITISLHLGEIPYSYTYTVKGSRINLDKIDKINQFSRNFVVEDNPDYTQSKEAIKEIDEGSIYSEWVRHLAASLGSGTYALLLNGTFIEAIISSIAGLISVLLTRRMQKRYVNFFLVDFLGALLSGIIIYTISKLYHNFNPGLCLVGAMMPLVPGIALTNCIRDSMAGNFMTGSSKLFEVILAAMALALGGYVSYIIMNWRIFL